MSLPPKPDRTLKEIAKQKKIFQAWTPRDAVEQYVTDKPPSLVKTQQPS